MKKRGFEIVSKYRNAGLHLPQRQTIASAGYDFECAQDIVLPSIWCMNFVRIFRLIRNGHELNEHDLQLAEKVLKPFLVPTGIKAYMPEDEVLILANRSSNTYKRNVTLPNGIGVIDSDYYNNEKNEGEIYFQLINYGVRPLKIKKGERIGQGIFMPYLKADNDDPVQRQRLGGFGSSGTRNDDQWQKLKLVISVVIVDIFLLPILEDVPIVVLGINLKKRHRKLKKYQLRQLQVG